MWFPSYIWFAVQCCLLLPGNLFWQRYGIPDTRKRIQFAEDSKIYLEGTTNVNAFRCDCEDRFDPVWIEVETTPPHFSYRFAQLRITSRNLNCRNEKMNRDMYLALQSATYPYIKVALLDNWQDAATANTWNTWFPVKARMQLTITHVTREVHLQGMVRKTGPHTFEMKGKKDILLTDYGITPPQAMFGMIKVNNTITLQFHLRVVVSS